MVGTSTRLESDVFGVLYYDGSHAVFAVQRETETILTVNPAMEQLLGRPRGDLLGAHVNTVFDTDGDVDAVTDILARGGLHEEVALQRLDGYPLFATLHVMHLEHPESGPLAACIAADNTERRLLERELIAKHTALYQAHAELERTVTQLKLTQRDLEQRNQELAALSGQLAQAGRRAAIGELSAGIAHSINNPMAALASTVRRIERAVQRDAAPELVEATQRYFARSRQAVARMEEIVASVRTAHRVGTLSAAPQQLDVERELTVALSLFETRLTKITVSRAAEGSPCAWVPQDALHHVVSNLIENSIQAMDCSGGLELSLSCRGDMLALRVHDTGPGVPESIRGSLFEPFVSARPDGTGLGLSMAQRLSREWGGDLRLLPSPAGALFELTFPRKDPQCSESAS